MEPTHWGVFSTITTYHWVQAMALHPNTLSKKLPVRLLFIYFIYLGIYFAAMLSDHLRCHASMFETADRHANMLTPLVAELFYF